MDHPRLRGEHPPDNVVAMYLSGSSPLTRGVPHTLRHPELAPGIIPAYAGSTPKSYSRWALWRDHPRLRGEHRNSVLCAALMLGSSPLTRGAPPCPSSRLRHRRIIPAYAGSTRTARPKMPGSSDHPRLRGEHLASPWVPMTTKGSSPLTRGALAKLEVVQHGVGIIPAYAGSTAPCHKGRPSSWDHPRLRGEHSLFVLTVTSFLGSSPLTRGALHL